MRLLRGAVCHEQWRSGEPVGRIGERLQLVSSWMEVMKWFICYMLYVQTVFVIMGLLKVQF